LFSSSPVQPAYESGVKEGVLPEGNVEEVKVMPPYVRNAMKFTAVNNIGEVLERALSRRVSEQLKSRNERERCCSNSIQQKE